MAGASFGDLVIGLRADSTQFAADLKKSQRTFSGFVSGVTSGFAKFGLAVGGVRTAFDLLIGPMQEAQEAALAERKLAQVFKSTASAAGVAKDAVMDYAAERQKTTSFDADDTVNAAAILGSFTNVKGDVFMQALTSAQDLSAFMGQDLQTSIIQIGKALNDPAKGVSALAKSGIQFSQSQKEQIKVLQDTGRVADAQAMILKELQTQFGGQAEALVDPIAQAKNAWGDFMETIGGIANEKLLPLMPKLIEGFEKFSGFIEGTVDNIMEMHKAIDDLALAAAALASGRDVGEVFAEREQRRANLANATANAKSLQEEVSGKLGGHRSDIDAIRAEAAENFKAFNTPSEISFDEPQIDMTGVELTNKSGKTLDDVRALNRETEQMKSLGIISQLDDMLAMQTDVPKKEQGRLENQVGSLEKDSQEAFEVLRANVGVGAKDKIPEKALAESQKQTKKLDEIAKSLGKGNKQVLTVAEID